MDQYAHIEQSMPAEGLFAEKDWLLSPEPLRLPAKLIVELEKLGHRLNLFQRACNQLYHLSVQGRQPRWVADYLDQGKPAELIETSRRKDLREQLPVVIRPDLVLTEEGFTIAEVDTVPGGIGLTAWLHKTFAAFSEGLIGGGRGMLEGFAAVFPEGDIVVSDESATYRPEMHWLARELNAADPSAARWQVHAAESYSPGSRSVYRFFEMFDLPNIPPAAALMEGNVGVTPPFKPYLEEKLWFALFWMRPLREFWRRELGEKHFLQLQKHIPYTWIIDPTPLPQHAVIPRLDIHEWREAGDFSQKQRDLILKISGFSELSWGSRGVSLGQDMPQGEWREAIDEALASFPHHPYILQQFHKGRLIQQPYYDRGSGETVTMQGRVRLCPYYFVIDGRAQLGGALAAICPADKKLLHGMKDAILVPAGEAV